MALSPDGLEMPLPGPGFRQAQSRLAVRTHGQGLYDVTRDVNHWLESVHPTIGLLTVFCRHTSASLVIQENADPDVQRDLQTFFRGLVREERSLYRHTEEGDDDMPAHIRSALTLVNVSIPVGEGRLLLGKWQGIYVFEHRSSAQSREIVLHFQGF